MNNIASAHKRIAEKLQTVIVEELKHTYREKEQDRKNVMKMGPNRNYVLNRQLSFKNWVHSF